MNGAQNFIQSQSMFHVKDSHKNVTTTQEYLRFQADEIKDNFPSLIQIIESMGNMHGFVGKIGSSIF